MEVTPHHQCAFCGEPAVNKCGGCNDAPEHQPGDTSVVVYCDSECQRLDWPSHRAICIKMKRRRRLVRAAHLMKAILLTYRECAFNLPLIRIEFRDDVLYLHLDPLAVPFLPWHSPYPEGLTDDDRHKEAALANSQCNTSLSLLGPLARYLLEGNSTTYSVIKVRPKMAHGREFVWHNSPATSDDEDDPEVTHNVVKLLLEDEQWVLDITGCQFGFEEPLIPSEKYMNDNVHSLIDGPHGWTENETSDLDVVESLGLNNTLVRQQRAQHEAAARRICATFIKERFDNYQSPDAGRAFLDGRPEAFQRRLNEFIGALKLRMQQFVDWEYGRHFLE